MGDTLRRGSAPSGAGAVDPKARIVCWRCGDGADAGRLPFMAAGDEERGPAVLEAVNPKSADVFTAVEGRKGGREDAALSFAALRLRVEFSDWFLEPDRSSRGALLERLLIPFKIDIFELTLDFFAIEASSRIGA